MVRVVPGKLPAKVIVAPNSPRARGQPRTAPAAMPGATSGNVMRRKTVTGLAPRVEAGLFVAAIGCAQGTFYRQHQKGQCNENLGQDHGVRRKGKSKTCELVERATEQS